MIVHLNCFCFCSNDDWGMFKIALGTLEITWPPYISWRSKICLLMYLYFLHERKLIFIFLQLSVIIGYILTTIVMSPLYTLLGIFAVYFAVFNELSRGEMRWCANGPTGHSASYSPNATRYNDELYVCMECENEERITTKSELSRLQCCNGLIASVGTCVGSTDPSKLCSPSSKCDGVKQCNDASDELGCNTCSEDSFSCNQHTDGPRCISKDKVCDSIKDCEGGKDEIFCPYHRGWCMGFLCEGGHPKCINDSQVCDGTKDCVDGSDENNCQYCLNQFRCRVFHRHDIDATSAECIGRFRVCNGVPDCLNGADETNCNRWIDWSPWNECGVDRAPCTRSRERSCVSSKGLKISAESCYSLLESLNETEVGVCPECMQSPETTTTSDMTTQRLTDSPYPQPRVDVSTTDLDYSKNSSLVTSSNKKTSFKVSLGTIGIIAGAACAGLFLLAVVIAFVIYYVKWRKKTGRWRPPIKLPGPSRSVLPHLNSRKVKNPKKSKVKSGFISHPYPLTGLQNSNPRMPSKRQTSVQSDLATGIDSGIEESRSNSSHEMEMSRAAVV